ncbi:TetR/AcrR family transcriptional regulator [Micromonospora mirobrigensis]|uniref:Transcriptional regulator, TetR family n=1 Tax=Micromonospora mirobrigensis TaxID=262898 RepID=A0A1C4YY39_9ACTN|nr:TetR/AcrR family transcriptional regulator [Micromonospora mirobrigensis]SCF25692.1 transcriptional regulator, TetR family [Micromonospora mirobrigensis]
MTEAPKSRRAEYAAATRTAIIEAARLLFARDGYFATKIEDIAAEARVAPATVYAVTGGKQGLIRTLVDLWSQAPIVAQTLSRQESLTDPDEILRDTAATVRAMRETYGDIMRLMLTTAPHHPEVAENLRVATKRYRDAVEAVAVRLRDVGGLRAGMDVAEATDILWFYFGYSGYFTLLDDNGWTYERSERWLVARAAAALR